MPMDVYTSKRVRLTLDDAAFSSGGEGEVHRVLSGFAAQGEVCVKIYYKDKRTGLLEAKVRYMVKNPPSRTEGTGFMLCWPIDFVTDASGVFMGFMMRMAYPGSRQLIALTATKLNRKFDSEWQMRYDRSNGKYALVSRMKLMNNIAIPVSILHHTGKYVLKDFKPENVLVTYDGRVSLVDMDSVQISENGRLLFPGTGMTPNYIPSEYYSRSVGKDVCEVLEVSWDEFAVGTVFYQLLFGLHPYCVTPCATSEDDTNDIFRNIARGLFPFGPNRSQIRSYPPLHDKFKVLPPKLQNLFLRTFSDVPSERPSAEDWGKVIHELILSAGPVPQPSPKPVPSPSPTPVPSLAPAPEPTRSTGHKAQKIILWIIGVIVAVVFLLAIA